MNERFFVEFATKEGRTIQIDDFSDDGIVLNGETSAWPRGVRMAFAPSNRVAEIRYEEVRRNNDWSPGQFQLAHSFADDTLSFRGVDPRSLPAAVWKTRFRIEDLKCGGFRSVRLPEGGEDRLEITVKEDARRIRLNPRNTWDDDIVRLLAESRLDGGPGLDWIADGTRRASRRACALNILAATRSLGLTASMEELILADVDRIYCRVRPDLLGRLTGDLFTPEGRPGHPVHERLVRRVLAHGGTSEDYSAEDLSSFRQKGNPSLQVVVLPSRSDAPHYAEFDIDLGDVYSLPGFFVHTLEVLVPGRTDHLKLLKRLVKSPDVAPFLFYSLV